MRLTVRLKSSLNKLCKADSQRSDPKQRDGVMHSITNVMSITDFGEESLYSY
jgi:hypothetical protein